MSDLLLPLAIAAPAIASLLAFIAGPRRAPAIVASFAPIGAILALVIGGAVLRGGAAIEVHLGGWAPPLGIVLRADGFSAAMLLATATIIAPVILFRLREPRAGDRADDLLWPLLPGVWAALSVAFLVNDLFSFYVALELLTFAAVPLAAVGGSAGSVRAALRYLLYALIGSLLYLAGVGLLYGVHGTLDLGLLAARAGASGAEVAAFVLMTVGLLAKTALFPFHLWLPPAHAGAPPAASAILSSLVVKGSYLILLRIWLELGPALRLDGAATILAALGAAAILLGSELALRQNRIKLLVAYSTVAQIGYLVLAFPIVAAASSDGSSDLAAMAITGGMLQAIAHASAKAAMFLAAGLLVLAAGCDEIERLRGIGRAAPLATAAFLIAGLSLMGLPPSGGFWAKWLLLRSSIESGQWWWALVILAGGLLAGGYVFRVVGRAVAAPPEGATFTPVSRSLQLVPLGLAIFSFLLGLMALAQPGLLLIGRTLGGEAMP